MGEGLFGPVSAQVVLDGSGNGMVQFAATDKPLEIENISVSVSSAVNEATATVYRGQVGAPYRHSGTYAGSSGDNNQLEKVIRLEQGERIWVVWTGGDAGATATAVVSGLWKVPDRGFRAR